MSAAPGERAGGEARTGGWGGGLIDPNFFIIGICALLCHQNKEFL